MKVLGIVGSLRERSYNRALFEAFIDERPEVAETSLADIGTLPLFNDDLSGEHFPESVKILKKQIEETDVLLVITPEYNRSIPGVLKNAIDWATRPRGQNSFKRKRVFVAGASNGALGTAVAQYDLRRILVHEHAEVFGYPEVMVGMVEEKFDANMKLIDEKTRAKIREAWARIVEEKQ